MAPSLVRPAFGTEPLQLPLVVLPQDEDDDVLWGARGVTPEHGRFRGVQGNTSRRATRSFKISSESKGVDRPSRDNVSSKDSFSLFGLR